MSSLSGLADNRGVVTEAVREKWGWFLALGIVLVLCGTFAIMAPLLSTLAATRLIGIVIAVAGAFHVIHSFQAKAWSGFIWDLLIGLIQLFGGALIWLNPFAGAIAITALIAWVFLLQGVTEIILSFRVRPKDGWGWLLFSGVISLFAGIWLLSRFPIAGLFVPGLIVGIALLFEGWAFIAISLSARWGQSPR
jgi:uncharacterized membrane protein HdeD (DUF308 family)